MIGWKLSRLFLLTGIFCWIIYPCLESGILTKLKSSSISGVCTGRVVVLSYSELNRSAQIYCLQSDSNLNVRLRIEQQDKLWKIVSTTSLSHAFYWPFWI